MYPITAVIPAVLSLTIFGTMKVPDRSMAFFEKDEIKWGPANNIIKQIVAFAPF